MNPPTCCKRPMEEVSIESASGGYVRAWHCRTCASETPLYRVPFWWLRIRVRFGDLEDEFWKAPWWMGAVGEDAGRYCDNTVLFVVLPVNVLIDWAIRLYRWARYRKGSLVTKGLSAAYLRGRGDGESQERARQRAERAEECSECEGKSKEPDRRKGTRTEHRLLCSVCNYGPKGGESEGDSCTKMCGTVPNRCPCPGRYVMVERKYEVPLCLSDESRMAICSSPRPDDT